MTFRRFCFPGSSPGKESACNAGDPSLIPESGRCARERIGYPLQYSWASLVAQLVKNLPAMWETWVWSLGWEDPLEKGTDTHSSILAWRIGWIEEPGRLQSMGIVIFLLNYSLKGRDHVCFSHSIIATNLWYSYLSLLLCFTKSRKPVLKG